MGEDRFHDALYVVRNYVVSSLQKCGGLSGPEQTQRSSRAGPQVNVRMNARGGGEIDDIAFHWGFDPYRANFSVRGQQILGIHHLIQFSIGWAICCESRIAISSSRFG